MGGLVPAGMNGVLTDGCGRRRFFLYRYRPTIGYSGSWSTGITCRWAKPTGPAFGRPDDRLRVPTAKARIVLVGTLRFAHPTTMLPYDREPF